MTTATPDALMRKAILEIRDLRAQLEKAKAGACADAPIAVVGMDCKLPGADGPAAYWDLLRAGRDAVREIPPDRWAADRFYDPDPEAPGKLVTKWAGLIDGLDRFDARSFGISPREAATMDPQQRLLLEVTWRAIEHACLRPSSLAGSKTGVFIGACTYDALLLQLGEAARFDRVGAYEVLGTTPSVLAGRLAYFFDLRGPAAVIDTACSSSLVAVHVACQSLRSHDCDLALAGGVAVISSPALLLGLSKMGALSPDGRCRAFDASANGFVPGEGVGVVVLKRLADAVEAGDRVLGVIRGSAVNQDGRSAGLSAPNPGAQQAVIREALARAGLPPEGIGYVETHGTGTSLGDPIEAQALHAVFGPRAADHPLRLGSVKTNLGHLQGAAGIAGLMKLLLALIHREIPPTLHLGRTNPNLGLEGPGWSFPSAVTAWTGDRLVGAVSAFGISGSNAHLVVEAPVVREAPRSEPDQPAVVFLSAPSAAALRRTTQDAERGLRPGAFAATARLIGDRDHASTRLALVAASSEEALGALRTWHAGGEPPLLVTGQAPEGGAPRRAFLYSGGGAHSAGMARALFDHEPVFRDMMDRLAEVARLPAPLLDVLYAEGPTALDEVRFNQPATFAVQLALTTLLGSWGVAPDVVCGHSLGEYAAAVAAGILTPEDGMRLVVERSRLMQERGAPGDMLAVNAPLADVEAAAARFGLSVAVVNGPEDVTVAGDAEATAALAEEFRAAGIRVKALATAVPSHCAAMDPVVAPFSAFEHTIRAAAPRLPFISGTTGDVLPSAPGAGYWARHLRERVVFDRALRTLAAQKPTAVIEIGPHPTLLSTAMKSIGDDVLWVPSLRRARPDRLQLRDALAQLFVRGAYAPPPAETAIRTAAPLDVPVRVFDHEARLAVPRPADIRAVAHRGHPLLGEELPLAAARGTRVWTSRLDLVRLPWLGEHRVEGRVTVPGAAIAELGVVAARALLGGGAGLAHLTLGRLLTVPDDGAVAVQVVAAPTATGGFELEVFSRPADAAGDTAWVSHAVGAIGAPTSGPDLDGWRGGLPDDAGSKHEVRERAGLALGPAFQRLRAVHLSAGEATSRIDVPRAGADAYLVHPVLLDAMLQTAACLLDPDDALWLPFATGAVALLGPPAGASAWARAVERRRAPDVRAFDVQLVDETGALCASIEGLALKRVEARSAAGLLHAVRWTRAASRAPGPVTGRLVVLADDAGVGSKLAEHWRSAGGAAVVVHAGAEATLEHDGVCTVRPEVREDYERLFSRLPPTHVVHLWSRDADDTALPLSQHQQRVTTSALHCAAALTSLGRGDAACLWLVTRGALAVEPGDQPCLASAPLWGLGAALARELADLPVRRVDLSAGACSADEVQGLFAALAAPGEDQLALRNAASYVPRLSRLPRIAVDASPRLRADRAYLVMGASAGVAPALLDKLVALGARHLVCCTRRVPGEAEQALTARLANGGARVSWCQADVASRPDVERAVAEARARAGGLAGVFHLAAVLDDGIALHQTPERVARVLAPKIDGAWNLHLATKHDPLELFVLFSSAAGVLGSEGQVPYAAANAFLDTLADARHAQGLPGLSIQWGVWGEAGRAVAHAERLARHGLHAMTPEEALDEMVGAFGRGLSRVAVLKWNPQTWRSSVTPAAPSSFLDELTNDAAAQAAAPRGDLRRTLAAAPAHRRRSVLLGRVREEAARVLWLPPEQLPPDAPFGRLGADSMMGLEIRNRLQRATDLHLPATLIWTHPTAGAVTDHLLALLGMAPPETSAPDLEVDRLEAEVRGLADAEIERRLLRKLEGA